MDSIVTADGLCVRNRNGAYSRQIIELFDDGRSLESATSRNFPSRAPTDDELTRWVRTGSFDAPGT